MVGIFIGHTLLWPAADITSRSYQILPKVDPGLRQKRWRCHPSLPCVFLLVLSLTARGAASTGSECNAGQWAAADGCPYANDGECDAPTYCAIGSDCVDCDPCTDPKLGWGGCSACVTAGCSWCTALASCMSSTGTGGQICEGNGWVTGTCGAADASPAVAQMTFNDPAAVYQSWYLDAINVGPVWQAGITGEGVNIFFQDEDLDTSHPDLASKYVAAGSVEPVTPGVDSSSHGTKVVGYAVAAANNNNCGVGVAYGATVSFAKFTASTSDVLTVGVSDNVNHVHSNSWNIDGCTSGLSGLDETSNQAYSVSGVSSCPFEATTTNSPCIKCSGFDWSSDTIGNDCVSDIASYCSYNPYDEACEDHWDLWVSCTHNAISNSHATLLRDGISNGRQGKGIIYVFCAGNEFKIGDNVNFEGWLNSIYTIVVGATNLGGTHAAYSSAGAAVLVSAPGGEAGNGRMITTTEGGCTDGGYGTSYATPIVSAGVALMLQANPNLRWRDVQDILVHSSRQVDESDGSWITNGAGLKHSIKYGFGQLDVAAAVVMAQAWTAADSKAHAVFSKAATVGQAIPTDNSGVTSTISVTPEESSFIESVEHVVVYLTLDHANRGDLEIKLTSPLGTVSRLAWRSSDASDDYDLWKFMTLRSWDETPGGSWALNVVDRHDNSVTGTLTSWRLAIYGKCTGTDASTCHIYSGADVGYDRIAWQPIAWATLPDFNVSVPNTTTTKVTSTAANGAGTGGTDTSDDDVFLDKNERPLPFMGTTTLIAMLVLPSLML